MTVERGKLIAVEGIDGCGKSTQARLLAKHLGAVLTLEPGGTETGKSIRKIVLEPNGLLMADRTEALLMMADRAQHVAELIEPEISRGRWVVSDRFVGSTVAYQGYGRGLDSGDLERMSLWACRGLEASLNVLIEVPLEVAQSRRSTKLDRMESEQASFHSRVCEGFSELARANPGHWVVVDGTMSVDQVHAEIVEQVAVRLGASPIGL